MNNITPRHDPVTRRNALRLFGLGGATLLGGSAGLMSAAEAAPAVATVALDKSRYLEGELMTLVVTETMAAPDSRTITIVDSAGLTWSKISDNGRTPVFTATAGPQRAGVNTVSVRLKRSSDGKIFRTEATYFLGQRWVARFPGDRPDRMLLGLAVTDKSSSNLTWPEATMLLGAAGGKVSARRCFVSGWISKSSINKWADWAEEAGVYPIISFKVPGGDWAGVAAGRHDAALDLLCATLEARGAAGRAPVCVAVHHEPTGDGDLAVWARMQEYLSNRFAPWKDVFCFSTISNGYEWGPVRGGNGDIARMYPRSLINTLNRNKHILACDTYDSSDPTKLSYTAYDRTSRKIDAFIAWARAEGVQRVGLGEFGCHDDIDLDKSWALIDSNRDIFAYACHFNSGQNSRADWRMIPVGYPPDPAVTSYDDRGGSAASAARLAAGKRMFNACARVPA